MSDMCNKIHQLFNEMKRFHYEDKIPENGIYVLFEKGEKAHGGDRIVRIGTHTGNNQLRSRLFQHFINENKDRSIFRKNIGRALLKRDKNSFFEKWELDLTSKKAKERFSDKIDFEKQKQIEKMVTKEIQQNFSIVAFKVLEKDKRLSLESKIISTISLCDGCKPSGNWLGLFSPKDKIRESGLWLVNELFKEPLHEEDFQELQAIVNRC